MLCFCPNQTAPLLPVLTSLYRMQLTWFMAECVDEWMIVVLLCCQGYNMKADFSIGLLTPCVMIIDRYNELLRHKRSHHACLTHTDERLGLWPMTMLELWRVCVCVTNYSCKSVTETRARYRAAHDKRPLWRRWWLLCVLCNVFGTGKQGSFFNVSTHTATITTWSVQVTAPELLRWRKQVWAASSDMIWKKHAFSKE